MPPLFQKYASMAVPRYTSYPTVPHFDSGVGGRGYAGWLEALNPAAPVSLYLHVPFCRKLCWYCGCNMKLASRYEPVADYVDTLIRELELVAEHLPGRIGLSHLHFGGGTPTALEPDDLERVMDTVRAHFTVNEGAELAIESDPRTLTPEMTRRIGALGFTRASFGIQEFDAKVQKAINRIQPEEMVVSAVNGLRDAGITGINFDLIYGLPHQTVDTLRATIAACAALKPDRLALFGYAHVPWMAKKQRLIDEAALPGAQARIDQATAAARMIQVAGYETIGLDHFALPRDDLAIAARNGTLRRNFQGYTTDKAETLLGVGATSIGRTPSGYVQNIAETGAWARAVQAGRLPILKGHAFQGEDTLRGQVIEALMCRGEVDLDDTIRHHGAAPGCFDAELTNLAGMEQDGLVVRDGYVLRLTEAGKPLVRTVASVFDAYLSTGAARHSVAV